MCEIIQHPSAPAHVVQPRKALGARLRHAASEAIASYRLARQARLAHAAMEAFVAAHKAKLTADTTSVAERLDGHDAIERLMDRFGERWVCEVAQTVADERRQHRGGGGR